MTRIFRRVLLAGVALAPAALPAWSQEDAPYLLGAITLTAEDGAGYVINTAQSTKSVTPIAQAPQAISVLGEDQLRDQGAESLGQSLSYTSGVVAQPFGNDPRFAAPVVRGFRADTAQYFNGLRLGRLFGAQAFETYGLSRVEVLRGPSSSLYGAGSPSGVINQVQKRAQSDEMTEIGLGGDTNDSAQLFFDVNRSPSEALSWRLTGIVRDDKTQLNELSNERTYLGAAARLTGDGATTIDLLASYTDDSPITPVGVPVGLTGIGQDERLRDVYTGEPGFDRSDRRMWNLGVEVSHDLDNGWTLSQGFRYEQFDWSYRGTSVGFGQVVNPDGSFVRSSIDQDERSRNLGLDTRLNGQVTTGAATHDLLFGLDVQRYRTTDFTIFGTTPDFDPLDPSYDPDAVTLDGFQGGRDVTFRQIGLYAQDEIAMGDWRATLGLRHDRAEQSGTAYGQDASFDDSQTTGRAALSYVAANGITPYLSYATSFEPLQGTDIDGGALVPTEGRQWEAGVKYAPAGFDGLFTATVYDLRQTNLTRPVSEVVDGEVRSGVRQFGEVKSRGFELAAVAELAEGWDIQASYALNETEQAEGPTAGADLPNAPRHLASLWLMRDFGNGLRAGGGIRHIGERFGDDANAVDLDAVTLVDLGATYTRGAIQTTVNLQNLTDEVYLASCGTFGCFYGEGRTLSAKVAYQW